MSKTWLASRALPLTLALVTLLQGVAFAQPAASPPAEAPTAPEASAAPAEAPAAPVDAKAEAREHFFRAVELFDAGSWAAALAEFLQSRALYPTRQATKNAAVCLKKLSRFDESLDMFEALLREFAADLPAADKAEAQREVASLRALVGTIDVTQGEMNAAIIVDGRSRGDFPLVEPLRVAAGTHTVRVFKEGFEPFEARVDVAGGQIVQVPAKLRALSASGRLRVTERSGKKLDVVVDDAVVGQTPWEGLLGVGDHVVLLRGEGDIGTQPAQAPVKQQDVTSLTLAAERLESSLAIEVTPAGATVAIDSVTVGRGTWDGRLRAGAHTIEVAAEGFFPVRTDLALKPAERRVQKVDLVRNADADLWQNPPKITFSAGAGFAMTPSFGGDVAGSCEGACARSLGIGVLATGHLGYELGSGVGFGIAGGYLFAKQDIEGREVSIKPEGLSAVGGTASDSLELSGVLVGATTGYRVGDRFPALFRLGAGALIGNVRNVRDARFDTAQGSFSAPQIGDEQAATYLYVDPEARVGVRFLEHFEVAASVHALFLFSLEQPKWGADAQLPVVLPAEGFSTYKSDAMTGSLIVFIAPGISARYDF